MALTLNGSTGLSGIVGSAGTPALQGTDTNTGYFFGTDTLGLSTGGTQRLQIDSSGNIKLGSGATQTLAIKNYGYSGSYKNIMIGNPGSNVGSVGICVDVSTISGGNFAAQHQAILGKNGILMPNNAGDNFVGVLRRDSSADKLYIGPGITSGLTSGPLTLESTNVGIGTTSPVASLEVRNTKANFIVAKTGLTVKSTADLHTSYDFFQIGAGGAIASYSTETATASTWLIHNAYRATDTNWKRRYADTACKIEMNSPGGEIEFFTAGNDSANTSITWTPTVQVKPDGDLNISDGDLVIGTAGHGIDFSATSDNAGQSSELLDDYEEGEYIPSVSANITLNTTYRTWSYTKIGRQVTIKGLLLCSAVSGTDAIALGLPFNAANLTGTANAGPGATMWSNVTAATAGVSSYIQNSGTELRFYLMTEGTGGWARVANNDISTSTEIYVTQTYWAA